MSERSGIWKTSLRLPPKVKEIIRRAAADEGCSMNHWMVRAIDRRTNELMAQLARPPVKSRKRR